MNRIPRLATLLALPLLFLSGGRAGAEEPTEPKPATAETPKPKSDEDLLKELVDKAVPVVEKLRGLKFKSVPPVHAITREQFLDRFLRDFDRALGGKDRADAMGRLLVRLGALPKDGDLRKILSTYMPQAVAANYDPMEKRISFLPGVARSFQTMVHEMTHAVDDQQFDLEATGMRGALEFDRILAFGALCEGDAQSIEYRFAGMLNDQVSLDLIRAMGEAQAAAILQSEKRAPPAIALAFKSQYLDGILFVESIRRGPRRDETVNDAFRDPPPSTEQVLHPEKFAAGEPPVVVRLPAAPEGVKVLVDTCMGELGTGIVLVANGLPAAAARQAAAGWGGDRLVLFAFPGVKEEGERIVGPPPPVEVVVWATSWDNEAEAEAFEKAMIQAFPLRSGGDGPARAIVRRGKSVDYAEGPLDDLAVAMRLAREASREAGEPKPRKDALPPPPPPKPPAPAAPPKEK